MTSRWRALSATTSVEEALLALLDEGGGGGDESLSASSASDEARTRALDLLRAWHVPTLAALRSVGDAQRKSLANTWPRLGRALSRAGDDSSEGDDDEGSKAPLTSSGTAKRSAKGSAKGNKGAKDSKESKESKDSKDGAGSPRASPTKRSKEARDHKKLASSSGSKERAPTEGPKWGSYEWMVQQQQLLEEGKDKADKEDSVAALATANSSSIPSLGGSKKSGKGSGMARSSRSTLGDSVGSSGSSKRHAQSSKDDVHHHHAHAQREMSVSTGSSGSKRGGMSSSGSTAAALALTTSASEGDDAGAAEASTSSEGSRATATPTSSSAAGSSRSARGRRERREEEVEAGRLVRTLDVTLRDALLPKGITNSFAELQLGERNSTKSSTAWGERSPVYNKQAHYTAVQRDETLYVRVYEVKKKGKPPKPIGVAELALAELVANEERTLRLELRALSSKDKDKDRDRDRDEGGSGGKALGECFVALEYRLTERTLLADAYYDDFLRVLMEPEFSVCRLLEQMVDETGHAGVAYPLVHVLTHYSQMHLYLENWIGRELSRSDDTAVLFRGDSLGIKAFDVFLSWIGRQYLQETLGPHIERVVREQLPCELQEAKLEKTDRLRENFQNFLAEATKLTSSIFASDYEAPAEFCYLFGALTQQVMEKFPYKLEVSVIAINGFLFLRFFVPAIMTPSLHALWDGDMAPRPASTLNLLARVVQKLANMNLFDRDREPHLHLLNDFLRSQQKEISLFAGKLAERKIRKETLARVHRVPDATLDITNEVVELIAVFSAHIAWWEARKDVPEVARLLKALRKLRRLERRLQMRLSRAHPSRVGAVNLGATQPQSAAQPQSQTPRDETLS